MRAKRTIMINRVTHVEDRIGKGRTTTQTKDHYSPVSGPFANYSHSRLPCPTFVSINYAGPSPLNSHIQFNYFWLIWITSSATNQPTTIHNRWNGQWNVWPEMDKHPNLVSCSVHSSDAPQLPGSSSASDQLSASSTHLISGLWSNEAEPRMFTIATGHHWSIINGWWSCALH